MLNFEHEERCGDGKLFQCLSHAILHKVSPYHKDYVAVSWKMNSSSSWEREFLGYLIYITTTQRGGMDSGLIQSFILFSLLKSLPTKQAVACPHLFEMGREIGC